MLKRIMKLLKQIRELILPMLEGRPSKYSNINLAQLTILQNQYDLEKTQVFYDLAKELFDDEQKRKNIVESKATTILSATGLILALITSFGKTIIFENTSIVYQSYILSIIFYVLFTMTIVYFSSSIFYSIKTLSRKKYEALSPCEIIAQKNQSKRDYQIKIGLLYLNKTKSNFEQINAKVDCMVMAQEHFKRGIFCIILLIYIFSIIKLMSI